MTLSFRPQIYDESETDQILNAKYFVWKNYTLVKWGTRKAFNQNSLTQLFNGDRRIVHCDIGDNDDDDAIASDEDVHDKNIALRQSTN
jgi:hypothetical protein